MQVSHPRRTKRASLARLVRFHEAQARGDSVRDLFHFTAADVFQNFALLALDISLHVYLIGLFEVFFCGADETGVQIWVLVGLLLSVD